MKEIKRTIEEVTGYEAIDGKVFRDKEECKIYEESAMCVMLKELDKYLVRKEGNGRDIIVNSYGYLLGYVSEDDLYAIYKLKDKDAVRAFSMVQNYREHQIDNNLDEYIGKEILVLIRNCCEERLWVIGSEDELRENYNEVVNNIFHPIPKEDKN